MQEIDASVDAYIVGKTEKREKEKTNPDLLFFSGVYIGNLLLMK